jgi:hypothetical protein
VKIWRLVAISVLATSRFSLANPGATFECSINPRANDNFLGASFRLVLPEGQAAPRAILVFIPGTDEDGRGIVSEPQFLAIREACHAALIGCDFRGEGLQYDNPRGGSGRALNQALAIFAKLTGNSFLQRVPLLLLGYSQGGIFVYNYICWQPDRVLAFATLKAISPNMEPKPTSFAVPGLLVAGEMDEPGRIREIAQAFETSAGQHSKWALLFEKNVGHQLDPACVELAGALFEAETAHQHPESLHMNLRTEICEPPNSLSRNACWFPNKQMSDDWKLLHRPRDLHDLMSMPDLPKLQNLINAEVYPSRYACQAGAHDDGVVRLTADKFDVRIDYIAVRGKGFALLGASSGTVPLQAMLSFAPRGQPWGPARGEIEVGGSFNGKKLEPLTLSVLGVVEGPVSAIPSNPYLGMVSPGSTIDYRIRLRATHLPLHVVNVQGPAGMVVTLEGKSDTPQLKLHWNVGDRLGRIEGTILVSFDLPSQGTLRIPILAIVSRK